MIRAALVALTLTLIPTARTSPPEPHGVPGVWTLKFADGFSGTSLNLHKWQPGRVDYYYDGKLVGSITQGITGSPMYLILDAAVDPTYGDPSTAGVMKIDYVRSWQ